MRLSRFSPQVDEERAQQMEKENGFITRWNDKKDATVGPSASRSRKLALALHVAARRRCFGGVRGRSSLGGVNLFRQVTYSRGRRGGGGGAN